MSFLVCISFIVNTLLYIFICVPEIRANPSDKLHMRDGRNVPCAFLETVNVTDDVQFANGSYLHDGVIIPRHLVGLYDYVYKDLAQRIDVEPHYRGCICKVKPCLNFCCPWGTVFMNNISVCVNISEEIQWPEPLISLTLPDKSLRTVNIFNKFAVKTFRPCEIMYSLQPEIHSYDEWHLFENGTLLRMDDYKYITKNEYCFVPTVANDSDTVFTINPANCNVQTEFATMKIINAYAMLFSVPFMVLTIIVYLAIPELRNQHGKSLVCYLLGLIIGYSSLSAIAMFKINATWGMTCKSVGYMAYFFFMASFFWLSVISFDLWHNFRGTHGVNRYQEKKRFIIYSLYAWGLAAVFLVFTWYAQERLQIPNTHKPGIGINGLCWLDIRGWSAMIYFFGPILLIIVANIVMFIRTSMKIHRVQREMARIMAREDSTRNLRTEKDKFGLFLRLFIVMGVTWSLEILSYFVGSDKLWAKVFYISDICNAIQGFVIFMLFVMKKKVKNLIINRFSNIQLNGQPGQSTNSTNSTNSGISNVPDNIVMQTTNTIESNDCKEMKRY